MSALILQPAERTRLAGALALLGSSVPGEVAAAAAAAHRIVTARGLTWADLLVPVSQPPAPPRPRPTTDWRGELAFVGRHQGHLTHWETEFTLSLRQRATVTDKQRGCLVGIATRLRARGCA